MFVNFGKVKMRTLTHDILQTCSTAQQQISSGRNNYQHKLGKPERYPYNMMQKQK